LHTKARSSQLGAVNPLTLDAEASSQDSRILKYDKFRDRVDQDTTSRLRYVSARKYLTIIDIKAKAFTCLQVLFLVGLASEPR
jgi:hypothetical protein